MGDLRFCDVSEYQSNADIAGIRAQTSLIAARAMYGTRADKMMPTRRDQIRAQKFDVVIWYLFLRASLSAVDQANAFLNLIGDVLPGEVLCVDFESDAAHVARISHGRAVSEMPDHLASALPTLDQRDTVSSIFKAHSGRPTLIYMSESVAATRPIAPNEELWIAAYRNTEPTIKHAAWQQTDAGGPWAGCGPCDTSIVHGAVPDFLKALGQPNKALPPCVAIRSTPSGHGYYQVGTDGGVFCYGDAAFFGSMGGKPLNAPIIGFDVTPTGGGYWLQGADYGVFAYGDAPYFGHLGS